MKMIKAYPHINQGGEYVQVSKLPFIQAIKLRNWLGQTSFVKIKSDNRLIEDCVQFSEYEYWFDCFYSESEKELEFGV